jgi:hypothetical protein
LWPLSYRAKRRSKTPDSRASIVAGRQPCASHVSHSLARASRVASESNGLSAKCAATCRSTKYRVKSVSVAGSYNLLELASSRVKCLPSGNRHLPICLLLFLGCFFLLLACEQSHRCRQFVRGLIVKRFMMPYCCWSLERRYNCGGSFLSEYSDMEKNGHDIE